MASKTSTNRSKDRVTLNFKNGPIFVRRCLQPQYNYTTPYLPLFQNAPLVSTLITVAYERPKFDIVFNGLRQLVSDIDRCLVT